MREAARAKGEKPKYNGRCRERKLPADHDKPFVVRFKAPQGGVTRFEDFIAGQVEVDQSEGDDFIIARSDGSPTYQFVVVVDDIDMGMTHVIRGEDHLSNTYKQVQLYEAFQAKASLFAHVPIILGPDKSKLSKRHGAVSLSAFKEQGILSEAMRNALVRLGWSHGDQELFTDEELKKYFDLDHCGRSAAMFDHEKLGFYNSHFFKQMNAEELVNRFKSEGFGDYSRFLEKEEWKNLFVASVERIQYMPELKDQLAWFESVKLDPELKDVRKTFQKLSVEKFEAFKSYLSASAWELSLIHI